MTTILGAAASGMIHNANVVDTLSHNVANVNTAGFKKTRSLSQGAATPGIPPEGSRLGVAQTTLDQVFSPGAAQRTDDPMHFAITDDTFFAVQDSDGATRYTRFGGLQVDAGGNVLAFGGRFLEPPVTIPEGMTQASVADNGAIMALDADGAPQQVGQITLVRFLNPQGLTPLGDGLYAESANSGVVTQGTPGSDGFATLLTGAVEGSNVDIAEEFTNLLIAQRAYSASAKTFMVGDEMLAQATNITR